MPLQIPYSGNFRRESKANRLFVAANSAVFLLITMLLQIFIEKDKAR